MSDRQEKADAYLGVLLRRLAKTGLLVLILVAILALIALVIYLASGGGDAGGLLAGMFLLVPVVGGYIALQVAVPAAWCAGVFLSFWLGYRNGPVAGALGLTALILLATAV